MPFEIFLLGGIMKNKFLFIFNSLKQAIVGKPMAFILLFFVFFATTVFFSVPSRMFVGAINDELSSPNYLRFWVSQEDFAKNNVKIGDYIRENGDKIKFEDESISSTFIGRYYNSNVKVNDTTIFFEKLNINFVVTEGYGITETQIQNKEKVITINDKIAKKYNIVIGDTISVLGNDFVVSDLLYDYYVGFDDFAVPYSFTINEWETNLPAMEGEDDPPANINIMLDIKNATHFGLGQFEKGLKQFGCTLPKRSFDFGTFSVVMMLVGMLVICVLATITIMGYWLKCNSKKYSTFKTLGCSPILLAFTMIFETLVIAILAIGLGLIADYIIGMFLTLQGYMVGLEWLHYLILIGSTLISAGIMSIVAVVKRAIAMPANTKYSG